MSMTIPVEQGQQSIWDKGVCMSVELRKPGCQRSGDLDKVDTRGTDKESLRLSKVLFECPQYSAIVTLDQKIRKMLESRNAASRKVLRAGLYLIPDAMLDRTERDLMDFFAHRLELVEEFLDAYPQAVEAARERLQEQFNPADYPPAEELRKAFSTDIAHMNFGVKGRVESVSQLAFSRAVEREAARIQHVTDECRGMLRKLALTTIEELAAKLAPKEDGKRPILRESSLEKVEDFLSSFKLRDLTNDTELQKLIEQAEDIVHEGRSDIRSDKTRDSVKESLDNIAGQIRQLQELEGRSFDFD